jgi:tungstate transport system substrate-binding protein
MATANRRITIFFVLLFMGSSAIAVDSTTVRMATTTTASSSGLLDVLVPAFEQTSGYEIELAVVGTGRALRMGRLGEVDVILSHAPVAERRFVADGWGVQRRSVMKNDFILVGPAADPAGIRGMRNAGEALKRIAETESMFVSRADDSGTHKKELECWSGMQIQPSGSWYYEAGLPMGDTLKMASEKQYYTLVDRGTWIKARQHTRLDLLVESDPQLVNPYSVIKINPERHPAINFKGATAFSDWLSSPQGEELIRNYRVGGERLFFLQDSTPE